MSDEKPTAAEIIHGAPSSPYRYQAEGEPSALPQAYLDIPISGGTSVWPWMHKRDVAKHLRDLWGFVLAQVEVDTQAFEHIKELIMANAEDYAARIDAATSELSSDLQEVKDALAAAVADKDEAVRAAVEAELGKLDGPIAALEALGKADDPANPVPVEETPAEAPAEPAAGEGDTPPAA
jgi:hypothetical protein